MCNTLVFVFMCIKNTLISVHGLTFVDYRMRYIHV